MNFLHLMNQKRFQITNAQLTSLENATKAVINETRVNALRLSDVKPEGRAIMVVGKAKYNAVRLASNGRWYLTGDYTYA
jgi:hypothetical protein